VREGPGNRVAKLLLRNIAALVPRSFLSLTRQRDLRDGAAVWCTYLVPTVAGTRLKRSINSEIVVVGAGISGAMIAQSLAALGKRPIIIDRRRKALLGSTAASTALLQFELDTLLTHLSREVGPRRAAQVWLASRDAVNELRTGAHRLAIRAHLQTRPSLYLAGNVLDAKGLQREVAQRQRIGLASEYLDRKSLRHHFGIDRAAALLNHGNAEANPVELAAGYLRQALKDGARFYAPHDIVDIDCNRRGTTLTTQEGLRIHARHVVFCTGYELAKIVPPGRNKIFSTWAIATRPQPRAIWPQQALIWESSEPYLYLRATQDGRVICGGEDEEFADTEKRDALTSLKTRRIERKLKRLFPQIDSRAVVSWTGSFGGSPNGMPTIGAIPGYPKCYAVMGYGGNGITFSMLSTKIITAAILGKKVPETKLFAFK
jgi:glycine/D-amino acid oxidase-like deaminating enzyme